MKKRNVAIVELNSVVVENNKICDSEKIQIISIVENYPEEVNTFINRNAYSRYVSDILDLYNRLLDSFKENGKYLKLTIEKHTTVITVTLDILAISKEKIIQIGNITKVFGNIQSVKMQINEDLPAISDKIKNSFIDGLVFKGDGELIINKFIINHSKKHIPYMMHFINSVVVTDRLITKEPTLTSMMIVSYCHDKIVDNFVNNKTCCLNSPENTVLH